MVLIILVPIASLALLYCGAVLLLWILQDRLVYYPRQTVFETPASRGLSYEDVHIPTADNLALHGWFVPGDDERRAILFCHGNGGNVAHALDAVEAFHALGPSVLAFDYRGYGGNAGNPHEAGLYEDGEAAWRYLTEARGFAPDDIVIVGRSLGGAVATWLASRHRPAAVVLESTFTSVPDVAAERFRFIPVRQLIRASYDNLSRIGSIISPLLIVHSADDAMVSFSNARRLLAVAPNGTQLLTISHDHNRCYSLSGAKYIEGVREFLDSALGRTMPAPPSDRST